MAELPDSPGVNSESELKRRQDARNARWLGHSAPYFSESTGPPGTAWRAPGGTGLLDEATEYFASIARPESGESALFSLLGP